MVSDPVNPPMTELPLPELVVVDSTCSVPVRVLVRLLDVDSLSTVLVAVRDSENMAVFLLSVVITVTSPVDVVSSREESD